MTRLSYSLTYSANAATVLFLHGFLGCRYDWQEVVDLLDPRYRCLRVDLPGHHWSCPDLPPDQYSMPECAQLVVELLDHCSVDKCRLVGYSMGGRLGLYLLTHFAERLTSAVIEAASPGLKTEDERAARRKNDERLSRRLREEPFENFLRDWYDQPLFQTIDKTSPRFEALFRRRRECDRLGLALSLGHMGTGVMPSLWPNLQQVEIPVLFIAGEKDEKYSGLAREMANLCPRGRVAIIPGAGHNTHFERPEEFSRTLTRFFDANK